MFKTRGPANAPSLWHKHRRTQIFRPDQQWCCLTARQSCTFQINTYMVWINQYQNRHVLRTVSAILWHWSQCQRGCSSRPVRAHLPDRLILACDIGCLASGAASLHTSCKSRVDLPIPGSPPIRIAEPATSPPPVTRSNSSMPVTRRRPGWYVQFRPAAPNQLPARLIFFSC